MRYVITEIPDTVIAYNVQIGQNPIGQVYLRNEYWHARPDSAEKLAQGGEGFVHGRGYESRNQAGNALARELVSQ